MRATMVRLVSWSIVVLGVPLFVAAEERMGTFEQACDASVWSVPEDETLPCNKGSACQVEYRAANGTEQEMWPEEPWRVRHTRYNTEKYRLKLNKYQPPIVPKYTEVGYKKEKLDPATYGYLMEWYEKAVTGNTITEKWGIDNVYANHWKHNTTMVYAPVRVQQRLFRDLHPLMEEWSGLTLKTSTVYGVRVYPRGMILANHVDRVDTHVISAIINVAQTNVDTDWPLYVKGHDGVAREILMEPGEIVYYESASVIHGRPTFFDGDAYANIFVHYAPVEGWTITTTDVDRAYENAELRRNAESDLEGSQPEAHRVA